MWPLAKYAIASINSELGSNAAQTMLAMLSQNCIYTLNYLREAGLMLMGVHGLCERELIGGRRPITTYTRCGG